MNETDAMMAHVVAETKADSGVDPALSAPSFFVIFVPFAVSWAVVRNLNNAQG
jgi:hypothetical protein